MVKYTASDLRQPATIYAVSSSTDADMQETKSLGSPVAVRGLYLPQPGREVMRSETVDSEAPAMFVIRYRSWLTADHVVVIRGVAYEIASIQDVEGRIRYQEMLITNATPQPTIPA